MQISPTPSDLAAATAILRSGTDPRQSLCRALVRFLGADAATLWELRGGALEVTAGSDAPPSISPRVPVGPGSFAGRAVADAARVFVVDAREHPDVHPQAVDQLGLRSVLAEPLQAQGAPAGAVVIAWRTAVTAIDPFSSGVISLMAGQAAMAIERADLAARLEHQALTDPLTDLPNRRGLARDLDREMARAARRGSALAFALMDLDRFKAYNDEYGHPAGDRLLVRAARAWRAAIRAQDVLARWGGEEFVVLLPDCGTGAASPLAIVERVRRATPDGQTASVGIAVWDGREPAHRLAERADAALYAAKQHGRDRTLAA
jgi:diguanylate cyclase (GGDEF)-like protein